MSAYLRIALSFAILAIWNPVVLGETVAEYPVPPGDPEQMPVLYTHGFNDDGAAWATGEGKSDFFLSNVRLAYQNATENAIRLFEEQGVLSLAVQWTAASPDEYSDPFATAEQGFAFLADEERLKRETDWLTGSLALHNRARPSFMDVLTTPWLDVLAPQYAPLEPAVIAGLLPVTGSIEGARQVGRRTFYLALTANRNTYNDSGRVDDHSTDLLDLLREERAPGGLLEAYPQVNILTHSKGSLVTRVMLSKAEAAGGEDAEYVANVVYNAPPFAGSSLPELLRFMYDPVVFTRAHLANPWLAQTWDEIKDWLIGTGDLPNPRLGDQVRALMQLLVEPFGGDFSVLEEQAPLIRNNIELLNVFSIEAFILADMANSSIITPSGQAGALIADIMNVARPLVTSAIGIPSFPTAREDLTPENAVNLLQTFPTAANPAQFINAGIQSPLGVQHLLWPDASFASVAADPSQIYDVGSLQGEINDTYVALSSARILAETDVFGPRMMMGDIVDTDHGGTTLALGIMATNWMSILLAPPTTLHLDGAIDVISEAQRTYLVSPSTTFAFDSADFDAEVDGDGDGNPDTVRIEAAYHQYRFVPVYGGSASTAWQEMPLGGTRSFSDAVAEHDLAGAAFEIQWRAVNLRGGREMIRRAGIAVAEDPPLVTDVIVQGPGQIVRRDSRRLRTAAAVRSSFFERLPHRAVDLAAVLARPEPDWMLRQPETKYLAAVFDKVGSVDYAWNDPTLSDPDTLHDVNALFLTLETLQEGYNTLSFQPYSVTLGVEKRGQVQTVSILVDNTPPEHSFAGLEPHAIGFRVGPNTRLQYRALDLESGGGQGNISVAGFSNTTFAAGAAFSLGETDLIDQLKAGPGGDVLVGGFITFSASAGDLVGNLSTTNFQAYFDFTAPTLTNVTVVGGIPTATGAQVFTNRVAVSVDVRDANASEFLPPCAATHNMDSEEGYCSEPFLFHQTVGVYARYTGTVHLAKGRTALQIISQDVFGNAGTVPLVIEYLDPPPSTSDDLTLLTPRIDNENSLYYDPQGSPTNFSGGAILSVDMSYDGRCFVFSSTGNGFVFGDSNQREDIFLSENGRVTRINTGAQGEQAVGGDSDSPAISGDGRYAYFRSSATNLAQGTSNDNLYVKDLETGRIAVISRHFDGSPINRLFGTFEAAPTYRGRYVFFASRNASFVDGLTDANTGRDIYMVDLDPDGNGDYFDDNYVTHAISTAAPDRTGNNESRAPFVSDDGRYLAFICRATDIAPDLGLNGDTADALLMKFGGSALDGTLDVSDRSLYVVNRSSTAGGGTTAAGVNSLGMAPDGDTILFSTRSNVDFTGDTNSEANQEDVYSSVGESFGIAFGSRFSSWQSRGVGGAQSILAGGVPVGRLTVASSLRQAASHNNKIAWVSNHTNLVPGDGNGVSDLFVGTAGGLGVTPMVPPVPNWIASNITSSAVVNDGGLTPDGRTAWWVSTQTYEVPYTPDRSHIYLRRIDPPLTNELTVAISGDGAVLRSPEGADLGSGVYEYVDLEVPGDLIRLEAMSDPGWRFDEWQQTDAQFGVIADVRLLSDRTVTAVFVPASAPNVSSLTITTLEDTVSSPAYPSISDTDPDDQHTLAVDTQPSFGHVTADFDGFIYTPEPDFAGMDGFTFHVVDRYGLSAAGTAEVVVLPVNDPPTVGAEITIALQGGTFGPYLPTIVDPDSGDIHTIAVQSQPAHGTASADADGLYYTPDPGYAGNDTFTFLVTDSAGASDSGSILFNVLPPPAITDTVVQVAGSEFLLHIEELPAGFGYTVQFTEDLDGGEWMPVPPTNQWPSTATEFMHSLVNTQVYLRLRFEPIDP